jgi:hypothetical protein
LRIVEIPIEYRRRAGGEAKLNSLSDGWRHLRFMLLYSPDYPFLLPSAIIFAAGSLPMALLLRGPIRLGNISLDIHPMVLGALLTILGFQVLIAGITTKNFAVSEGFAEGDRFISMVQRYFNLEGAFCWGL